MKVVSSLPSPAESRKDIIEVYIPDKFNSVKLHPNAKNHEVMATVQRFCNDYKDVMGMETTYKDIAIDFYESMYAAERGGFMRAYAIIYNVIWYAHDDIIEELCNRDQYNSAIIFKTIVRSMHEYPNEKIPFIDLPFIPEDMVGSTLLLLDMFRWYIDNRYRGFYTAQHADLFMRKVVRVCEMYINHEIPVYEVVRKEKRFMTIDEMYRKRWLSSDLAGMSFLCFDADHDITQHNEYDAVFALLSQVACLHNDAYSFHRERFNPKDKHVNMVVKCIVEENLSEHDALKKVIGMANEHMRKIEYVYDHTPVECQRLIKAYVTAVCHFFSFAIHKRNGWKILHEKNLENLVRISVA